MVVSAALFQTTESTTKRRAMCETTQRAELLLPMATAAPGALRDEFERLECEHPDGREERTRPASGPAPQPAE